MTQENQPHEYFALIIGAGPGGTEVARELARNNKKTAVIETGKIGGTCLNRGCIPAKTMLYMAEVYRELQKINQYGINIDLSSVRFDFDAMIKKREEIMDKLRKGLNFQLKKDQVEVIEDYAEITGKHEVSLKNTGRHLTADFIILASGGRSRRFEGFKEDDSRYLTSDNIFEITSLPKSLCIVGAGPVGTEFANFFHTLGTDVHIIDQSETVLNQYDHRLGKELIKSFRNQGISCHLNNSIKTIDNSTTQLKIELTDGQIIESQYILSAIGVDASQNYIKIDIEKLNNLIKVNENLQTSIDNIYALGDLIGKSGSAYGAEREAKFVAYQLLGLDTKLVPINYATMPDVIFTHPEIGTCGLSEQELQASGIEYSVKEVQFFVNAKAQINNETQGKIWMYVEKNSEKILGVHIIGSQATEIIHLIPVVLLNKMSTKDYLKTVWGHPVMSEIIKDVITMG